MTHDDDKEPVNLSFEEKRQALRLALLRQRQVVALQMQSDEPDAPSRFPRSMTFRAMQHALPLLLRSIHAHRTPSGLGLASVLMLGLYVARFLFSENPDQSQARRAVPLSIG